jgi:hypothetical protein
MAERRIPRGMKTHIVIRQGEIAKEIVHAAQHENADLIVLCAHSAPTAEPGTLGLVAAEVISTAPCAVLTVRKPIHASNGSEEQGTQRTASHTLGGPAMPPGFVDRFTGPVFRMERR